MLPHFCGDWVHDIVHNTLVLLSWAPEWLPTIRAWAEQRLVRHDH